MPLAGRGSAQPSTLVPEDADDAGWIAQRMVLDAGAQAARLRRQASEQAATIREAAEREAAQLRAAIMKLSAGPVELVTVITPEARPETMPAGQPGTLPARRPQGPPRQLVAMRVAAAAAAALFLVPLTAGTAELVMHGFPFFVFRSAGTGETGANGLQEDQGPGQPDAPKPALSQINVRRNPVTGSNG
jgi:hypothetical protein